VPRDNPLEDYLRAAWQANRMPTRMVAAAARAAQQGGMALKFAYDKAAPVPLSFQTLAADTVRCYYHPHNRNQLLMVRVQYPYQDPVTGNWMLYREEWTAEEEVHYQPIAAQIVPTWISTPQGNVAGLPYFTALGDNALPDNSGAWGEPQRKPNPFGIIPITPIKNLDADDCDGIGDLWGLFRAVDRVNLIYALMDRSNQFDSQPNLIFLDVDVDQQEADKPLAAGQPASFKSDGDAQGERKGQIIMAEASGKLRSAMMEHAKDLRSQILAACSSVEVDQAEFTNKGNLTQAVLAQLYGPLIEITDEKRKTYGEDGICKFLESVCVGLTNAGLRLPEFKGVKVDDHDTYDVTLKWAPYFALTEEEKQTVVKRLTDEVDAGVMTTERVAEHVAQLEGIEDVAAFLKELKDRDSDTGGGEADDPIKLYQGGIITRNEARKMKGLGPAHQADSGPAPDDPGAESPHV
jgi:hypothetical protein